MQRQAGGLAPSTVEIEVGQLQLCHRELLGVVFDTRKRYLQSASEYSHMLARCKCIV